MKIKLKRFVESQKPDLYFVEELTDPIDVMKNEYLSEDEVKQLMDLSLKIVDETGETVFKQDNFPPNRLVQ